MDGRSLDSDLARILLHQSSVDMPGSHVRSVVTYSGLIGHESSYVDIADQRKLAALTEDDLPAVVHLNPQKSPAGMLQQRRRCHRPLSTECEPHASSPRPALD